ncbi:Hypothetical protein, putative [Bodo saltans]|uniref:Uncharacterized protein n=1 Tax=Bodo saltans TaxID=75058 RepID=A0A0S4JEP8_BODSA|nr:Hypothetical protein, putative [Bodo saltans]|eukprot:CUG87457.1 Hypothetical protein, putative [Bodo saltans]
MLYFGVQGLHMARKSVHELPKAPLPSTPRDIYTSLQDTNYSAASADRIKELEGIVTSLQAKNRALVEELKKKTAFRGFIWRENLFTNSRKHLYPPRRGIFTRHCKTPITALPQRIESRNLRGL